MKYKFYVYKIIGLAEIEVENQPSKKEAKIFVMQNSQYLNYKKPDYFYILTEKEIETVK